MSCQETRERLSDFLEEAMASPERALVRAHLEGCPECRRELDRLRATVSLLSRVERPRAPVGFVDRVTAAVHPVPWYQRLGRRLFLPLNIKLPVQAAAMLVIAVLGVYLLQRTPELRDAARVERETAPSQKDLKAGKVESGKLSEPMPRAAREAENTVRAERRPHSPQTSPPLRPEYKQEPKKEADADRLQMPAAPAAAPAESRVKSRDAAEGQSAALAPAPPAMAAKRQSATSSVLGRLNVKSRPAAEQDLADLLARLGGSETGRRQEPGATVVEVLLPEARYADFVSGLTTLGAWTPEGQPTALPAEPPQIRLSIRISE